MKIVFAVLILFLPSFFLVLFAYKKFKAFWLSFRLKQAMIDGFVNRHCKSELVTPRKQADRTIDPAMFVLDIVRYINSGMFFPKAWNTALDKHVRGKVYSKNLERIVRELRVVCDYSNSLGTTSSKVFLNIGESFHEKQKLTLETKIALTPAKTTIRILSFLPLFAVGLGYLLGANPVTVFFYTFAGRLCFILGIIFYILGQVWVKNLLSKTRVFEHL